MRDRFCQMIEREIKNRRAGKPAQIIVKTNSMEDQQLMKLFY
jgi:polyphosphate kinase